MPVICSFLFFFLALFPAKQAVSASLALGLGGQGRGYVEIVGSSDFKKQAWL